MRLPDEAASSITFSLTQNRKDNLRASVDSCIGALRGTKKIDLFEPARLDGKSSVEETVGALAELLKEGKFDHIGLSEVRAESLRRGHAVSLLPIYAPVLFIDSCTS